MTSDDPDETLRGALKRRLLGTTSKLPTGTFGRLGTTARNGLRVAAIVRKATRDAAKGATIDPESLVKLITSIGQLKGVAMKMGQIMSYIDVALPDELRVALSTLQTHSQPMPIEEVRAIVRAELGDDADAVLKSMEEVPIAAASIGQVHRSTLPDGTAVAVKVQYHGIDTAIANEFGAASVGARLPGLLFPAAHIGDIIGEARARFLEECDYQHEARMQQRFAELYAGHPVITVPAIRSRWCSRRVLTSTFVEGMHFEDYLATDPAQEQRDRIGTALFEFYVGSLFRHRLYNCDPHPGNYLPRVDGTMAVLDYGCCREFDEAFVAKLAALTLAVHGDRREDLHAAFLALGMVREGKAYDFDTARSLVRAFYGPMLLDETQVIDLGAGMQMREMMRNKMELMKLALPGEFLFLFRIRFGLMSVLARLGTRANWYRLERACLGIS